MKPELKGLAGLMLVLPRVLSSSGDLLSSVIRLSDDLRLVVAPAGTSRENFIEGAKQTFADAPFVSRSATDGHRAMVLSVAGFVGVDVETVARVDRNVTKDDAWLTAHERALVVKSADPVVELACHWVLKEAYGKALGVGLGLPLESLTFGGLGGKIVMAGPVSRPSVGNWGFGLYRHGAVVIGVAHCPIIPRCR